MDKLSNYNIEIEYQNGIILYNSFSDRFLFMSLKDYSIIETLLEHLSVFKVEYPHLYESFKYAGFIIPSDFDELSYLKFLNTKQVYASNNYRITINPTLDCNVKCWYCSVVTQGAKHYKTRMKDNIIDALIKHINILTEQHPNTIILDWFGGEPLMYFDEVIKKISDYSLSVCKEKNIYISQQITTNATLLDENRIRYLKDSNFKFFQISIDGNEKRQNLIKCYSDKNGTYKDVIRNINLLSSIITDATICLRINYDRQTLKDVIDITNDLAEHTKNNIIIDFQRVWQIKCTDFTRNMLEENINKFRSKGYKTVYWGYRPGTFSPCYADSLNHYVVNYDGKLYKCTARDYSDKLSIGTLKANGQIDWNNTLLSKMFSKSFIDFKKCRNCKILPLCMGPCIQKRYESCRDNDEPICVHNNIELDLSTYVINKVKRLNQIQ